MKPRRTWVASVCLFMLMIGTNKLGRKHSVQDTIAGIKCDVAAIHEKLPDARILLLAVFPRGAKADDHFRGPIKQVNEAISKLDGKENVKYLDIGPKFLDDMGDLPKDIMPDALHPNQKGYEIWAEAVNPTLEELMK
jgi:lysophospholipase L1-like esterase